MFLPPSGVPDTARCQEELPHQVRRRRAAALHPRFHHLVPSSPLLSRRHCLLRPEPACRLLARDQARRVRGER